MPYEQFIAIGRETLYSTVLTVLPVLIAALIAGLLIGILQAATSINEATLASFPNCSLSELCWRYRRPL